MLYCRWIVFAYISTISLLLVDNVEGTKPSICRCDKYAYDNKPFVAVWNSPTIGCDFNYSEPINLKKFGIYENDHQTWDGKRVTVFPAAQLGLYPYYVMNGQSNYNGGLPQLVDLGQHLRKARMDIMEKIPDPNFKGLAVIDWEAWRPIWDTNWNTKRIYKVRSVELVRSQHPTWTLNKLIEEAKHQFEGSARAMFEQTIALGKEVRPKALWGFYGFPDCFANQENRYQCTPEVQKFNDRLDWLYSSSTALYPSMYLLEDHPDNRDYVLGRLRETLRFATKGAGHNRRNIPVFAYHRNIYENYPGAFNFLSKDDLDNTIGLAADVGASGIVLWGNRFDENTSPEVCLKINDYVANKLGPYLKNKIQQIESCSTNKCGHRGHCIQRAILTPPLIKKYEEQQRLDTCNGPVSLLHDGNVLLQKKSQVPEFPLANTLNDTFNTQAQHNATRSMETDKEGFQFDLGTQPSVQEKPNIGNLTKHVNGSTINGSIHHGLVNIPKPHGNQSSVFIQHNVTHHQARNVTHPAPLYGNNTHLHGNKTNIKTRAGIQKIQNIKKSDIPRPPVRNGQIQQHTMRNGSQTMDQKKSKLAHQLLSSVQGSLFTTPQLLRRQNISKTKTNSNNRNNGRKSNILKSPVADPLSMTSKKSRKSWLPHMYVILIGVSLGGALMFSLIFVAVYYYISLKDTFPSKYGEGKLFHDEEKPSNHMPPKAHSSPKGSETVKDNLRENEKKRERFSPRGRRDRENNHDQDENFEKSDRGREKRRRFKNDERPLNIPGKDDRNKVKRTDTSNLSRSSIPRPRSYDRSSKSHEVKSSRTDSREERRRSNIPTRSKSLKRERSIKRSSRREDDETSEYEVNINELRAR